MMLFTGFLLVALSAQPQASPVIGGIESVHTLAGDNAEVAGLAFDDASPAAPRLFVLDKSGRIFCYKVPEEPAADAGALALVNVQRLPVACLLPVGSSFSGLSFSMENRQGVFYAIKHLRRDGGIRSEIWRLSFGDNAFIARDLSKLRYRLGNRAVRDLSFRNGQCLLCYDASGYTHHNRRVLRGMARITWRLPGQPSPVFVKHMPDAGTESSLGVACMTLDGHEYIWGTAGGRAIYCAEGATGRGLFYFPYPAIPGADARPPAGLAFGAGSLWVPASCKGPDKVCRINVTRNLDAPALGPKMLRHLTMTIITRPESAAERIPHPGRVYHYYSRPYGTPVMPNQGIFPETERLADITRPAQAPRKIDAAISLFGYDPAGDATSRQTMGLVAYPDVPAETYASQYDIDYWTRAYKKFIYPHRADSRPVAPPEARYLEDDVDLLNLQDTETYQNFTNRIKAHIRKKYGVAARLNHPYWAARNALEYIQDSYYYPVVDKDRPAAVDYDRKHYDANPGNLKIKLSEKPYDQTQIIACSGTSVMLTGIMRHLGIPARWIGTATQHGPDRWDKNSDGLLTRHEKAPSSNGHRYTQVWLGGCYGWVCFDATPSRPPLEDFDPPPPLQPQWRYMNRAAAGPRKNQRLVFNVGSKWFIPLVRDFEYDAELAAINSCGGDQRYNLQGRFEHPENWRLASHRITVSNLCFIDDITLSGNGPARQVSWTLSGKWDKDPQARLSIHLAQTVGNGGRLRTVAQLVDAIPAAKTNRAEVDLSKYRGKNFRVVVRKIGDSETGGASPPFDLPGGS